MKSDLNYVDTEISGEFSSLKKSVEKIKISAIKKRISQKSRANDLEYLLGAFMEMYEPHLQEIVILLSEKGYALDTSSGFGVKNAEFQAMTGDFSIDYVTKNKLEKIGVKFREYNGSKSLIFWPENPTLENILAGWMKVINTLPDKGKLTVPASSSEAVRFRRKYIPEDMLLRAQRLFERLKFETQTRVQLETKKRQKENSRPNKVELILGLFIEEIEPQVRKAIIEMNKKGYSTDKSGFMDNPCLQMIEGDFLIDEKTKESLEKNGVVVETNPSGYTRLQYSPAEADILKIKKKWSEIVSLLPDKKEFATISMTRKARNFRLTYE